MLAGEFEPAPAATITPVGGYRIVTEFPDRPGFGNGGTLAAVICASDGVSTTLGAELFSAAVTGLGQDSFGWLGPSGLGWALGAGPRHLRVSFEVRAGEVRAGQAQVGALGGNSPNPLAREIFRSEGWIGPVVNTNGWRIMGDPGGGGVIPEPATRAMPIAGLGLGGGTLRRRRLAAA